MLVYILSIPRRSSLIEKCEKNLVSLSNLMSQQQIIALIVI